MRGKKILAVAGVIAVLLVTTASILLFVSPRQTVTVWHSKTVRSNEVFLLTFQITNQTGNFYFVLPYEVKAKDGAVWKRCFEFSNAPLGQSPILAPSAFLGYPCKAKNLPSGCPLRFTVRVQKRLTGLAGFIQRLRLRVDSQHPNSRVPLNPFDKRTRVYGLPTEVVSDEFSEPAPPASTEHAADSPSSK